MLRVIIGVEIQILSKTQNFEIINEKIRENFLIMRLKKVLLTSIDPKFGTISDQDLQRMREWRNQLIEKNVFDFFISKYEQYGLVYFVIS